MRVDPLQKATRTPDKDDMKAALSIAFDDLRGKAGDVVVQRCPSGLVVKPRVVGRDPRTPAQEATRAAMSRATRLFRDLTPQQCEAWRAYAQTVVRTNAVDGRDYHPSAVAVFTGLAVKLLQIDPAATPPLTPPATPFAGDGISVTARGATGATSAENAFGVTFTARGATGATSATEPLSAQVKQGVPLVKPVRRGATGETSAENVSGVTGTGATGETSAENVSGVTFTARGATGATSATEPLSAQVKQGVPLVKPVRRGATGETSAGNAPGVTFTARGATGETSAGNAPGVTFTASAANAPGVLTELLLQPLPSPNRTPERRAYRTRAFVAFTPENLSATVPTGPGAYAAAYRFVDAATGQTTALVTLGTV